MSGKTNSRNLQNGKLNSEKVYQHERKYFSCLYSYGAWLIFPSIWQTVDDSCKISKSCLLVVSHLSNASFRRIEFSWVLKSIFINSIKVAIDKTATNSFCNRELQQQICKDIVLLYQMHLQKLSSNCPFTTSEVSIYYTEVHDNKRLKLTEHD